MLRAAAAVVAGFISIGMIGVGLDFLFEHIFTSQYGPRGEVRSVAMMFFILGYTLVSCIWGGFFTATIAENRAKVASWVLAAAIVIGTIYNFSTVPNQWPLWWKALTLLTEGPAVVLGSWLRMRTQNQASRSLA